MWRDLLRNILLRCQLIQPPDFTVRYADRHPTPEEIPDGIIVVVRGTEFPKWACFRCPGGCGTRFQLSLNPERRPGWRVAPDWLNRATVAPSVRQLNACRAHFWIHKGHVEWCPDSAPHVARKSKPSSYPI